jgi:hypothetical protein
MIARRALTIGLVVSLGFAAAAEASWTRPVTLARTSDDPRTVLAASPGPGAALAWVDDDPMAVTVRRIDRRGELGRARVVSPPLDDLSVSPNVAMDAVGRVVVSWSVSGLDSTIIHARRMGPGGRLGPLHTIARLPYATAGGIEELAIDAAGNATIAWQLDTDFVDDTRGPYPTRSTIQLRRLEADGTLGPIVELPSDGARDFGPALAVDPAGLGALAWVRRKDNRFTVRALALDRDGAVGPARDVSVPQQYWSGGTPKVALDRGGRATVLWSPGVGFPLYARQLATRGLGPLVRLARTTDYAGSAIAVDGFGRATVAWVRDAAQRVEARRFGPRGAPGRVRVLSAGTRDVTSLDLAVDRGGNATVAWSAPELRVRRISRHGRVGHTRTLVKAGVPLVAVDAAGTVTVAWQAGNAIKASRLALLR